MIPPYEVTKDGLESQFQVNYLSHFLLTQLLLPKLNIVAKEEIPRIVSVSSTAHYCGDLDFQDLQGE